MLHDEHDKKTGAAPSNRKDGSKNQENWSSILGRHSMMMALEPRFMFDGAVAATVEAVADDVAQHADEGPITSPDGQGEAESRDGGDSDFSSGVNMLQSYGIELYSSDGNLWDGNDASSVYVDSSYSWNENIDDSDADSFISLPGLSVDDYEGDELIVVIKVDGGALYFGGNTPDGHNCALVTSGNGETSQPSGDGGYSTLVLKGLAEDINKILLDLSYKGPLNEPGEYKLTIEAVESRYYTWDTEGKYTGREFTKDTATITLENVNTEPTLTGLPDSSSGWTVAEDTPFYFKDLDNISIADFDIDYNSSETFKVTVSVKYGVLFNESEDGYAFADGKTSLTYTGPADGFKAWLDNLVYQGETDFYGNDTLTFTVEDNGKLSSTYEIAMRISDVNDLPELIEPGLDTPLKDFAVNEGGFTVLEVYHQTKADDDITYENYHFVIKDVDNQSNQISFTYDASDTTNGKLQIQTTQDVWVDIRDGQMFYLDDLLKGNIRYLHTGGQVNNAMYPNSEKDTIVLVAWDGGTDEDNQQAKVTCTMGVTLKAVNQAPELEVKDGDGTRVEPVYDTETGETTYRHVVYEGEQLAIIKFEVTDIDDTEVSVKITQLPTDGTLWRYNAVTSTWVEIGEGDSIRMTDVRAGYLAYSHNGKDGGSAAQGEPHYEPDEHYDANITLGATRPDSFTLQLIDAGGGTGTSGEPVIKVVEEVVELTVYPSNDLPEFDAETVQDETVRHDYGTPEKPDVAYIKDIEEQLDVNVWNEPGTDAQTITKDMLGVKDSDGTDASVVFTIQRDETIAGTAPGGSTGFYLKTASGYQALDIGDSFTLKQVDEGKIVYIYTGGGTPVEDSDGQKYNEWTQQISFIVRDGSKTIVDAEGIAHDGTTGLKNSDGIEFDNSNPFEGGVGEWVLNEDTNKLEWVLTEFRLTINGKVPTGTEGGTFDPGPKQELKAGGDYATNVFEGGKVVITGDDLAAWVDTNKDDSEDKAAEANGNIVYRIESKCNNGVLVLLNDDNSQTVLTTGNSFTQADVDAGRVVYIHNGSETLSDSMMLSLSNGGLKTGSKEFSIDVASVNDQPIANPEVIEVTEGPTNEQATGKVPGTNTDPITVESGFDADGTTLTADHFGLNDRDENTHESSNTELKFVFLASDNTASTGTLQYSTDGGTTWQNVVYASDDYRTNPDWDNLGSATRITKAMLDAGLVRYVHNGEEVFTDSLKVVFNDGKGITAANKDVWGTTNGSTLYMENGVPVRGTVGSDGTVTPSENGQYITVKDGAYEEIDAKYVITGEHGLSLSAVHDIEIKISMVNDAPRLETNEAKDALTTPVEAAFGNPAKQNPAELTEGEYVVIGKGEANGDILKYTDNDASNDQLMYFVTQVPKYGKLYLNTGTATDPVWTVITVNSKFTQTDINEGRVIYVHDGVSRDLGNDADDSYEHHKDKFVFYLTDGDSVKLEEFANENKNQDYWIKIEQKNEAPVIVEKLPSGSTNGEFFIDKENTYEIPFHSDSGEGYFQVDDPDYYSKGYDGVGDTSGIVKDEMQVTLTWGYGTDNATVWGELSVDDLSSAGNKATVVKDMAAGTLTITGTKAEINALLDTLKFVAERDTEDNSKVYDLNETIVVKMVVDDLKNGGVDETDNAETSVKIHVSPTNTAPKFDDMGTVEVKDKDENGFALITKEDTSILVKKDADTYLQVYDVDEFKRNCNVVTITVDKGTASVTGMTMKDAKENDDGSYSFKLEGTNEQINNALKTLQYTPKDGYSGEALITLVYADGDETNVGTGDSTKYETTAYVKITVTPVNETPTVSVPAHTPVVGIEKNTGKNEVPLGIVVDDRDFGDTEFKNEVEVTVSIKESVNIDWEAGFIEDIAGTNSDYGQLTLGGTHTDVVVEEVKASDGTIVGYVLKGSLTDVNSALGDMKYQTTSGTGCVDNAEITIQVHVDDLDNGAHSDGDTDTKLAANGEFKILINDTGQNDAPGITFIPEGGAKETHTGTDGNTVKIDMVEDKGATVDGTDKKAINFSKDYGLTVSDPDSLGRVTITITLSESASGKLTYNKPILTGSDSFSGTDSEITYTARMDKVSDFMESLGFELANNFNGKTAVEISITDDGVNGALTKETTDLTIKIDVGEWNDAPVVKGTGTASLDSINEDVDPDAYTETDGERTYENDGKTVSDLFANAFNDETDQEHTDSNTTGSKSDQFLGIVVTGSVAASEKATVGAWQYYDTDTKAWVDITGVSASNALFLTTTTKVRFQPAENYFGTPPPLTAHLVDSSLRPEATAAPTKSGDTVDLTATETGKETRYSSAEVKVNVTVNNVNDAPTVSTGDGGSVTGDKAGGYTVAMPGISEDATTNAGKKVSDIFVKAIDDSTDKTAANGLGGIIVVGNTANATTQGTWQYNDNGTWRTITENMFIGANTEIRFDPARDYNGAPPALVVHLADNSGSVPTTGSTVDGFDSKTGTGGTSRYTTDTVSITITVAERNDAPVISDHTDVKTDGAQKYVEIETIEDIGANDAANTGKTVLQIFDNAFDDTKDNVTDGSNANPLLGVVVVGVPSDASLEGKGEWQYLKDGAWTKFPTDLSDTNALFLDKNVQIRFQPAPDYNGTPPALTVRLVDSSTVASGGQAIPVSGTTNNISSIIGGESRYGSEKLQLRVTVDAVNDSPVRKPDQAEDIYATDKVGGNAANPTVQDALVDDGVKGDNPAGYKTVAEYFGYKFHDGKDDVTGGSSANTMQGVVVTDVVNQYAGTWEFHDGEKWVEIKPTNDYGIYIPATAQLRFTPASGFPDGDFPSCTLTAHFVDNSTDNAAAPAAGGQVDKLPLTNTANDDPTDRYSNRGNAVQITIGVNQKPVIDDIDDVSGLNSYQDPILLAPNGSLSDTELDQFDDWDNAVLTIGRGDHVTEADTWTIDPNADDVFDILASGPVSFDDGKITVGEVVIGSVVNSGGKLELTFNENATTERVNTVLQNITYQNKTVNSTTTDVAEKVQIIYDIKDGNTDSTYNRQGAGGEKQNGFVQEIDLTQPAYLPNAAGESDVIYLKDGSSTPITDLLANDSHPYGDSLTIQETLDALNSQCKYGTITYDPDTGKYVYTVDADNNDVKNLADGNSLFENINYTVVDGHSRTAGADWNITIKAPDPVVVPSPVVPPEGGGTGGGSGDGSGSGDNSETPEITNPTIPTVPETTDPSGNGNNGDVVHIDPPGTPQTSLPPAPEQPTTNVSPELQGDPVLGGDSASNNNTPVEDMVINQENKANQELGVQRPGFTELVDVTDNSAWPDDHQLYGNTDEKKALINIKQDFPLPDNLFVHTNADERLEYVATLPDGSPLPDWMEFDPDSFSITATPPEGSEGVVTILIRARDSKDNTADATVVFKIGDENHHEGEFAHADDEGGTNNANARAENEVENEEEEEFSEKHETESETFTQAPEEDADGPTDGEISDIEKPDQELILSSEWLLKEAEDILAAQQRADAENGPKDVHPGLKRQIAETGSTGLLAKTRELVDTLFLM